MTSQGQEVEGDIYGLDVIGIDDDEGYVIIASTHKSKDPAHKNRNINHGKIDVYDSGTMQCVVTVPCDHPVSALRAFKPAQQGGDMWVVYSSMDRFIRTVHVTSLGTASGAGTTAPKASRGVMFSLETEVLHARFPTYSTTRRPPFGWTTFTVSRDGRLGASAYGQVGSRSQFHYCTAPGYNKRRIKRSLQRKYFRSVFRMWDIRAAHEQWSADEACAPQPLGEVEPVLAELAVGEPDREPSEKNWHPGGYYVGALAFSPDDKYLVMALLTEDDGETLSPFLSVRDSVTLQTVWTMNNVIGFNIVSNLEPDLQYWLSCLHGDSPDTWFVAFASVRAVTCIVMNTRDRKHVQGKRAWGVWKNAKLTEMALCELSDEFSDKKKRVLISHPDKRMVMQYFPEDGNPWSLGTLGDPGTWNQDERASEAAAFCRKRVFNPYHTPPPASLPPWGAVHALPDLGGEIQRQYVDANAGGIVVTVSRLGEIKVSDLSRYMTYTPPERHEDPAISCAVTPDHRHVTTGTKRGSIGVWDARTGAMVAIHQKPMPSLTPATAVATTPDGAYILCMQSNQIHYFRSKSLVEYGKNSGKKVYDNQDMLMYTSRYRKDSSPVYTERDDLDVSPDGTLFTAPHPLDGNLNVIVGVIGAARGDGVPPMALVEVHKKLQGQTFKGNYRGRFSPCGRYLGAYGSPRGFREMPDDQRPPHVKLFQKGASWDEWTEVAFYRAPSGNPSIASDPNLGACSAMAFLPDGAHLVTGAQDGVIRLHGVPDLEVVTNLRVHTNTIHSMRAVSWSGSSTGSGESALVLSCSADHWVKVTRVVAPPGGLTVVARYCCPVEPLCVSGFMGGETGVRADGEAGRRAEVGADGRSEGKAGGRAEGGEEEENVGGDTLYVHAGDTGGLLSILKVDMGELK